MSNTEKTIYVSGNGTWDNGIRITADSLNNIEKCLNENQKRCTWQKLGEKDIELIIDSEKEHNHLTERKGISTPYEIIDLDNNGNAPFEISDFSHVYLEISPLDGDETFLDGEIKSDLDSYDYFSYYISISDSADGNFNLTKEYFLEASSTTPTSSVNQDGVSIFLKIPSENVNQKRVGKIYSLPSQTCEYNFKGNNMTITYLDYQSWFKKFNTIQVNRGCSYYSDITHSLFAFVPDSEQVTIQFKVTLYGLPMIKGE